MKYFTPQLYVRGQSPDETTQREVERLWEEEVERYDRHLATIAPQLSDSLRAYADLLLHDSVVESLSRRGDRLVMVLRRDVPPRDVVTVTYLLAGEPVINKEALPAEQRCPQMEFLYDELDVLPEGDQKVFVQAILFSNGWEMQLHFRDVEVVFAEPLYPGPTPAAPVPQTA
jgi:hypothetical protein